MTRGYRGHKFKGVCRQCGAFWFSNDPTEQVCTNDRCSSDNIRMIEITDYDLDNIKRIKKDMARLSKEYDKFAEILKTLPWIGRDLL